MAIDKKFIKIKEDVLDYAMGLWGVEDRRQMDPVVDLLIDVFAYEAYKIHQEIDRSDKQILSRLSRVLIPQRWSLPYPAHGLLTVHPQLGECNVKLRPEDPFFTHKIVLGQKDMQIFFSPLSTHDLLDARIKYKVFDQHIDVSVKNRIERSEILSRAERLKDYSVWIGLNMSDGQLATLKEITLCLLPEEQYLLPYLQDVKVFDVYGNQMSVTSCAFEKENQEDHYFEDIISYYNDSYIKVLVDSIPQRKTLLEMFPGGAFEENEIDAEFPVVWLRIELPEVFGRKELDNLGIHLNTYPVVNRRLISRHHSFATNGRIAALSCTNSSYFLNVHSLLDNNGNRFINRLKQYQDAPKGVYSLFFGDLERFDENDAHSLIHRVLQLIREDGNAFAAINSESFSSQLQELFDKLESVEKSAHKIKNLDDNVKAFLLTVPYDESSFGELKYWVSQGDNANMINSRNLVQQFNLDKFDATSISFQTTTIQGTIHQNEQDFVNSLRYGLLSKERIVSREDIISYIYHRLGDNVKDITINDGVAISPDLQKGIIRTTEINIQLNNQERLPKNLGRLAHSLEKDMSEKSISHNIYKIQFVYG